MPYASDAQRRFFNANRKQLARQGVDVDEWNQASKGKKLPERVSHKKEASSMSVSALAAKTAAQTQVIKFATDANIAPAYIEKLAADLKIDAVTLVKRAYADPQDFRHVLQLAAGVPITGRLKKAGMGADMLKAVLAKLKSAGGAIDKNVLQKVMGNSKSWNDTVGKRTAVAGGAGLAGAGVAAGVPAAASAVSSGVDKLKSGVNSVVQQVGDKATELKDAVQPHLENAGATLKDVANKGYDAAESTAIDMLPTRMKAQVVGDMAKRPAMLGAGIGTGLGALGGAMSGGGAVRGGIGGLAHGGLIGGGIGAGMGAGMFIGNAYGGKTGRGIGALAGGALGGLAGHAIGSPLNKAIAGDEEEEKKMKPKWASDLDFVKAAMVRAIQTKQAQLQRTAFVHHLDKVASHLPLEKQASVRVMQAAIAQGKPLSHAIKLAYPQLNGEQRGILASDMVHSVVAAMQKSATGMGIPTVEPKSYTVPMKDAGKTMATACS